MMYKLLSSKKGMTLIEIIISLAMLAVISVPLLALFESSLLMTKRTHQQIEVNAITRNIKEIVTDAFIYDTPLESYISANPADAEIIPPTAGTITGRCVKVNGVKNKKYKFDVEYVGKVGTVASATYNSTHQLLVTLRDQNDKYIQKFKINICK